MKRAVYLTNIDCYQCKASVRPFIEGLKTIERWHMEMGGPHKLLVVWGKSINDFEVINAVQQAGFIIVKYN